MAKAASAWFHSRQSFAAGALVIIIVAYVVFSRALDTGSYWEYLASVILLILGIKFIVQIFKHGNKV